MRVTEGHDSESCQHGNTGVSSLSTLVDILQGGENILLVDTELSGLLESGGEDVQENLRVGGGVDVTVGLVVKVATELVGVDQVTVLWIVRELPSNS